MRKKFLVIIFIVFIILMLNYTKSLATTDLPKVYFQGDMSNMTSKEDKRDISIRFESSNINYTKCAKIKWQGTSSLAYDKKNYTIKFYKDNTYDEIERVDVGFGWGEQSEYCLKANWIDKTHSRNIVSARIGAKIQDRYQVFTNTPNNGTIDGFPVEIYLNEEFLGLYTWNIPKSAWMWNMDEENPNHIVIAGDAYTNSTAFKEEVTNTLEESGWECEVGTENEETITKLNRLINFVNNSSDEEFIRDFELYLDKDSALNYLVMLYLIQGEDNFSKNLMLVTYDGMVWYPSLYDLDSTFGTEWHGEINSTYESSPETITGNKLWKRIRECFPNEIANRWFEYRKDLFTKESLMNEFTNFINGIPTEAYQKEAQKWGEIPGQGIDQIEEFLDFRLPYIDNIMYEKYTIDPSILIQYSIQQNTNQNVIATLVSNREDIIVLKDEKETYEYTYTFTKNGTYTFECQDFKGNNKQTVTATVDWIDKDSPIVTVEYAPETETNGEVTVVINANEEIQGLEGWKLGEDKCSLKKVYSKNIYETVEVKDLLGNVTEVEINVSNISTIPFITSVVYSKTAKTNEDILVTIISNKELQTVEGWTLSDDNLILTRTFESNINMNIEVTSKKGQSKVINILIENIDKEIPVLEIEYSNKEESLKSVLVTIKSNEELKEKEGWALLTDRKQMKKEYSENIKENITFEDLAGNKKTITINIDWIDKNAPIVTVEYNPETETDGEVTVVINANEEIQEVEGWKLGEDRCSLKKVYSENIHETVDVKDLSGNVTKVEVNVSNISTAPFITSVVYSKIAKTNEEILVTIISNKEFQAVEGWTLSDDNLILSRTFEANTNMNIEVISKKGQSKVINILIENIDKEIPVLEVEYSTKEETLKSVFVTIKSNEELKEKEGWILSTDRKQMKKEYSENIKENVTFEDLAGNEKTITIEVANIIKMTFNIDVQYSTNEKTSGDVIVTIISNKQLKKLNGWELSDDKYKLTRKYTSNVKDEVIIYSVDNEEQKINIIINNIENKDAYDEEQDTTVVEGIIPNAGIIQEIIIVLIVILIVFAVVFNILQKRIVLK